MDRLQELRRKIKSTKPIPRSKENTLSVEGLAKALLKLSDDEFKQVSEEIGKEIKPVMTVILGTYKDPEILAADTENRLNRAESHLRREGVLKERQGGANEKQ